MKTVTTRDNLIQSGMKMPKAGYRMDDANKGFFMKLMRDNVYEDIIGAVVREYITNAIDEHSEHNVSQKVCVTIPTQTDPTFSVRDFGLGLNPKSMEDVYISYGAGSI